MSDSVKNPPRTRILILEEQPLLRHGLGDYLKPLATSSRGSLRYATHQENEPVMETSDLFVAVAAPSAFGERSFDVVVCQFGAMFFPDRAQAYREARRVLRPGGRLLFNVWDRISENEYRASPTYAFFFDLVFSGICPVTLANTFWKASGSFQRGGFSTAVASRSTSRRPAARPPTFG